MSITQRTSWYFLSSVGVPILGFATLPLFTTRLGPEQFGSFALGTALASVISAAAGSISSLSLPTELMRCTETERRSYLAAVLLLALLTAAISCVVVFFLYFLASTALRLELLTPTATALIIAGGFLNSLWAVCVEILTIEGRASAYAVTTFLQAIVNTITVSIALFALDNIEHALFWGFLSAALTGVIGALFALAHSLKFCELRVWFPVAARGGLAALTASLSENGKVAVERFYLGAAIGIIPLGLLAHAQYYKNASMVILNAFSRGVLPTALSEAREDVPLFSATLRLWVGVQAIVVAIALCFALLGNEIIGMLTHGKFVDATPYTVALLLALLLQTAAKPHSTLLLSRGKGHVHAHLNTISIAIALAWLFVSVPYIGVWGAISSFLLQILIHRIAIYRVANRLHRIPFPDSWVVGGITVISTCMLAVTYLGFDITVRIWLLATLYVAMLWKLKPILTLMWPFYRNR